MDITINTADGAMGGYLASPAAGRGPGIVVIQEIFGVNKVMRDLADGFSARGYFALAPDLFWRLEPGVQLTDHSAARTDADASVGYYGVNIDQKLGEVATIKKPLMLHIAGKDQFVKPDAQKKIVDAFKTNPRITIHQYPEMDHAFAREGGAHYDKACADLANGRTAIFFRQHLS